MKKKFDIILLVEKLELMREIMAKPGIPVELPKKRMVPDVSDPMRPKKIPVPPVQPVRTQPREPVPAGR